MLRKLMQFLGFYGDDDYDLDEDEYAELEERPRTTKKQKQGRRREDYSGASLRLIFCRGVPSERIQLRLRDALLEGIMVLLDLHELDPREFEERGRPFINFMGGVAFAHKGCMECLIEPALYLVTPHEGMFDWAEEETLNDGAFDRQGR